MTPATCLQLNWFCSSRNFQLGRHSFPKYTLGASMMPLSKNTLWLFLISCGGDFIPVVACLVGETQESLGNLLKFNLNPQMHPVTPEWHKMWSRLAAQICHFFGSQCGIRFLQQKMLYFNVSRKKCRTFRDKTKIMKVLKMLKVHYVECPIREAIKYQ